MTSSRGPEYFHKALYLSALMVPSQRQVTHAMCTNTPPYHHRCWLLNFVLITIQIVLLLFSPDNTTSMISKTNWKCELVRPQHTFPLCVSSSQMISGPEKLAAFLGVVDLWLSLCMVEF
ncbi:hypothetical protein ATANTOWER_027025 [Ataeniobius toweri]|uniref:Uncharacterized protein n=1 Tax=Ataeniobius toweri TaxID=208326 RepID=A0ABU7CCW5_9TELE|nr:hypothetical protein [Ataeniobius toweri]